MVITGNNIVQLVMLMGLVCSLWVALQLHSRVRKMQLRMQVAENRCMLLEIENARLNNAGRYRSHAKYQTMHEEPAEQDGATFELCKRTNTWRVT